MCLQFGAQWEYGSMETEGRNANDDKRESQEVPHACLMGVMYRGRHPLSSRGTACRAPYALRIRSCVAILCAAMGWRRVEQGIETQTLEIQPATCPVCRKGLYRNITFLTGGWARCSV